MISILIITKGHNSIKMYVVFQFIFFACHLIMLYICTKFYENIFNGFKVIEWTLFPYLSIVIPLTVAGDVYDGVFCAVRFPTRYLG